MEHLAALVRRVHDGTALTDHRAVAKEVRKLVPDEEVEAAFLEALTTYVRVQFSLIRQAPTKPPQPARSSKSAKRTGIREWWRGEADVRYSTANGQKILRYFTPEDCLHQAALDRAKSAELARKAERWEALAQKLTDEGKQTVGDLL